MATSSQHKLAKIRKPRVHITYDLHIENATEKRELPFVIGVLSNLFGQNKNTTPYKERKFSKVEKGNFDAFMDEISPEVNFHVKDTSKENATTEVNIKFGSMQDFNPDNFIKQNEVMGDLLKKRKLLTDLLAKIDGNEPLIQMLLESLKDNSKAKELADMS